MLCSQAEVPPSAEPLCVVWELLEASTGRVIPAGLCPVPVIEGVNANPKLCTAYRLGGN